MVDRRDGYRAEVDRAVNEFATARQWSGTQIGKARRIVYRVIWTESDWRLYANKKVPGSINVLPNDGYPSHGGDALSVGLYQQMEKWGWGDTAGSMSPYISTQRFLNAMLRDAPNWMTDNESSTAQRVQRSQYDGVTIDPNTNQPYPFAANYQARTEQVDALAADLRYFANHG